MNWLIEAFDPIKFGKIKSYAERIGWTNIRWINGFVVGIPPKRPWTNGYTEEVFLARGQLDLF